MSEDHIYDLKRGDSPLLISMPHSGINLPDAFNDMLTAEARRLPDTDWFIPELYAFVFDADITVLKANFSRFVIDLNRPKSNESLYPGRMTTGLCPEILFNGKPLYKDNHQISETDIKDRLEKYWHPYHSALNSEIERLKSAHGFCILYDAHSIQSRVPELFEDKLADLNLGTNHGKSCDRQLQNIIESHLKENSRFSWEINTRFIGGYITRHFGSPLTNVHALQMEIAQCSYMKETTQPVFDKNQAAPLETFLKKLIIGLMGWRPDKLH